MRRKSITSSVAFNQIGPSLPQALRLARADAVGFSQLNIGDLPTEDSVLSMGISGKESVILSRNAEVVTELQDLFSWKYVDFLKSRSSKHLHSSIFQK